MSVVKNLLNSEDKKRLFSNFMSLSVLQGANYILPLITLPYLVRVLGPEKFGLIAFAQAFIAYFNILTDYGFNLSATREISIYRDDKEKISEIFSSVIIIKLALMTLSFIIMTIIVFSFEKFRKDWLIYYFTFGMVLGQTMFPVWFFQGMERMKYITILNITARLIFTISIFVFIRQMSDYIYVPLLNSIGFCVAGVMALWIIFKNKYIFFKKPTIFSIQYQLREGWTLFVSSFSGSFYRNFNVLVMGFLTSDLYVGYYAIAEKIIKVIQSLQNVVGNVLFPYLSKKVSIKKDYFFYIDKKYREYLIGIYGSISLLLFFSSPYIVYFINGRIQSNIITDLKIMSSVVLIGGLNYYYGVLGLVVMNYKREFSNAIVLTGSFNILISFVLVYFFKDLGASLSFMLSELFLLVLIYKRIIRIKLNENMCSNSNLWR